VNTTVFGSTEKKEAYIAGEEVGIRRSLAVAIAHNASDYVIREMQYRLAKSLSTQYGYENGTIRDLSQYVECKRLLRQVVNNGAPLQPHDSRWYIKANVLFGIVLKVQGRAMEKATGELTSIPGFEKSHNVARFLSEAAWWILLQVSIKEGNDHMHEKDWDAAIHELKHTLSWHNLKVGISKVITVTSFDHPNLHENVGEGDLELMTWDWFQQRAAIEARLAHVFLKKKDYDSALMHLWESLALYPTNYRRAVELFELTSIRVPTWRPVPDEPGSAWKQVTGRPFGKASDYSWRATMEHPRSYYVPDTIAIAALGYQLRRHYEEREKNIYYIEALHEYERVARDDPDVDSYMKHVARELQILTAEHIDAKKFTTAQDYLRRAKLVYDA